MTTAASRNQDAPVAELVTRAGGGDQRAWEAIVERYAPLVWSICRRYRLDGADADDAGQAVWLQLMVRTARRAQPPPGYTLETDNIPDECTRTADDELLQAERHAALREAFTCLPPGCQRLIALLIEDPPVPYAEISARLGIPVGNIGPIRGRCLQKLRNHPAIAALIDAGPANVRPHSRQQHGGDIDQQMTDRQPGGTLV